MNNTNLAGSNPTDVIVKDIHCPYCNKDNALMISKTTRKSISVQTPAYGLKWLLSVLYLSFLHIIVYGFKTIEFSKKIDSITYGFCPHCGNTYSMAPPAEIKEEVGEEKFYKIKEGKVITGFCKGVSEYTGISLLWIRIMTIFYGLTIIGTFLYFLISFCIPFKEDAESDIPKKFYTIQRGKVIMGLCKGISVYTETPVVWIRIMAVILIPTIIVPIAYFIVSAKLPDAEEIKNGE